MKRITIYIILVTAINLTVKSQYSREYEYDSHYGMNVSNIHSGSGHGYGISINSNIQKGRKSLEVGAIYQISEKKISGADLRYKVFLGHFNDFLFAEKLFSPYLQYNLIYQKVNVNAPTIITRGKSTIELPDLERGTVGTMEHYVSLGLQMKICYRFFVDGSLGLGAYIGSVDKENKPASFGIHKDNHGFTTSFKLGIGYRIN